MNILTIDTSEPGIVKVGLESDSQKIIKQVSQHFGSQVLLDLITQILTQANLNKSDLSQIKVATGPGSYTGIRVGVAVANALGFGLGIPVNDKEFETELKY